MLNTSVYMDCHVTANFMQQDRYYLFVESFDAWSSHLVSSRIDSVVLTQFKYFYAISIEIRKRFCWKTHGFKLLDNDHWKLEDISIVK